MDNFQQLITQCMFHNLYQHITCSCPWYLLLEQHFWYMQYIPWNMHTCRALLCSGAPFTNMVWLKSHHGYVIDGYVWVKFLIHPETSMAAPVKFFHPTLHDDVIKWKHFPRNWPFVREIHRSPVNFPHKGQWRGALMFSLIYAWINDWVNNREAGDLRRQHGHYDVIVMLCWICDPLSMLELIYVSKRDPCCNFETC